MAYCSILLVILCSVPAFEWLLYSFSIEHIKSIKPFRDQYTLTTQIIHMFSYAAEGLVLFMILLMYWSITCIYSLEKATRFVNFSCIALFQAGNFLFMLKIIFHHSRPYLDNFTLADTNIKELSCSAEFGNPSGHMLTSTHLVLSMYWYITKVDHKQYFADKLRIIQVCVGIFIIGVAYSRVYTGRHTFDQVIVGALVGAWNAHFFEFYVRPYVFLPSIDRKLKQNHTIEAVNVLIGYVFLLLIGTIIFIWVELSYEIPKEWFDNIIKVCPRFKKTDAFHFNIVGIGYAIYVVVFYTLKAYQFERPIKNTAQGNFQIRQKSNLTKFFQVLLRPIIILAVDYILTDFIPMRVYGKKDIGILNDFLLKKVMFATLICLVFNS